MTDINHKNKLNDIQKLLKKNLYNYEKIELNHFQNQNTLYMLDYLRRDLYEKKRLQKKTEEINLLKKRFDHENNVERSQKRVCFNECGKTRTAYKRREKIG